MLDTAPNPGDSNLITRRIHGERRLANVFYPGGMRQARHRHGAPTFSFVESGQYSEVIGRRSYDRRRSTLIFHPAGECHSVEFESDVRILSVEFRDGGPENENAACLDRGSSHSSELVAWLGARLIHEMVRVDSSSELSIDGIIAEILAEGSRGNARADENGTPTWFERAKDLIHDSFNVGITLAEISEAAGVHPAHLSRVFRQNMGCTIGEYIRRLKFEFACSQILSTRVPLCEIAYSAGFADQSHFNRIFRAKMGITPYTYRKLHFKPLTDARFVQDFERR
jgi:AraC family transcriptional regulator